MGLTRHRLAQPASAGDDRTVRRYGNRFSGRICLGDTDDGRNRCRYCSPWILSGNADARGRFRKPSVRRRCCRRWQRHCFLATDSNSVFVHHFARRLRLSRAGRILDGQGDALRWSIRPIHHSDDFEFRLCRARHHGDPRYPKPPRQNRNHARRPVHDLFGATPYLCAADRGVRAR